MNAPSDTAASMVGRARMVVIKVGSSLMVDQPDRNPRAEWMATLAHDIVQLRRAGAMVLVVSSGAVALGWRRLGIERSSQLDRRQAAAAVGQGLLMNAWANAFADHDVAVGQLLLTLDDSESPERSANARATISVLLGAGAVPVVNENDSVATEELKLGDNDRLSARVAELAGADLLLLLSDVDGLYDGDPGGAGARHIPFVDAITPEIEAMAGGAASEGVGTGGMATKLAAASHAGSHGCATIIASGREDDPIARLIDGANATVFAPAHT